MYRNSAFHRHVLLSFIYYFLTYKIQTFNVSAMKITKRLCNRQWTSVVLYAVYPHLSFLEMVIKYDKFILNNIVG
jgi:hypothetical protein